MGQDKDRTLSMETLFGIAAVIAIAFIMRKESKDGKHASN